MLSQQFISEMKQQLLQKKAELDEELKNAPIRTVMGNDRDSQADEVNVDEVNSDIRDRAQADLDKINQALQKIEDGTYGMDDEGKEISQERLRALPWADKAL